MADHRPMIDGGTMSGTKGVVIFLPSLKTLGGNRTLLDFAATLTASACDVRVVVVSDIGSSLFGHQNLNICKLGRGGGALRRISDLLRAAVYVKRLSRDHTVVFSEPLLAIAVKLLGGASYVRFHQADDYVLFDNNPRVTSRWSLRMYKLLCLSTYRARTTTNVFVSGYVLREFLRHGGRKSARLHIASPGVDADVFAASGRLRDTAQSLVVGTMARDLLWKGFADFCAAISLAESKGLRATEVVLIGHDQVDATFSSPVRKVRPANDSELAAALRQIDIFIHPSWVEGYGLPPLEAMACGCAVIVSDSGGPSEYAVDGQNCLVFAPRDVADLSDKLLQLAKDLRLRSQLRERGIETARRFSVDAFVQKLADAIRSHGRE